MSTCLSDMLLNACLIVWPFGALALPQRELKRYRLVLIRTRLSLS